MPRDAEVVLKLLEAPRTQKGIAQDKQCPALTHHRQRARHGAQLLINIRPPHRPFPLHALQL